MIDSMQQDKSREVQLATKNSLNLANETGKKKCCPRI